MVKALIGYTGFVGSNLTEQMDFDYCYNSSNIGGIRGKQFDTVYCAAAPGTKWYANQNPTKDFTSILELLEALHTVKCRKLILLSTIGVYDNLDGVYEDYEINISQLAPYGENRLLLETYVERHFNALVVRLPSIFGHGLKKNFIYDAIRDEYEYAPNANSTMQFYCLDNLAKDIDIALANDLKRLNISSEPIKIAELCEKVFDKDPNTLPESNLVHYNMKTKHSAHWNRENKYLYSKDAVIDEMRQFVIAERKGVK